LFGRIFAYRQNPDLLSDPRARERLLREIRPVENQLEGYRPSSALARLAGEGD